MKWQREFSTPKKTPLASLNWKKLTMQYFIYIYLYIDIYIYMILYIIYSILYITGENRERMHNNNPPTDILWPWHESRGNTTSTGSFEGANLRLLCLGQEWAQKWGCNYSFKFVINIITIYHKYMHIIIHICIYVYNNLISYKSIINYNYTIIYIYTYI